MYRYILLIFLLFSTLISPGNDQVYQKKIVWHDIQKIYLTDDIYTYILTFKGSLLDQQTGFLPVFSERIKLNSNNVIITAHIRNAFYDTIPDNEIILLEDRDLISADIEVRTSIVFERKKPFADISFVPIRKNPEKGIFEKLLSFELVLEIKQGPQYITGSRDFYAMNSVLATGEWYRIGIHNTGIHIITYNDLVNMGIDVVSVNPDNIRIFGNGNGMLPEANGENRYDDLIENPIMIIGGGDGQFDETDYILFYGLGPTEWRYNQFNGLFEHQLNLYTDNSYYFLNTDLGAGKRITQDTLVTTEPTDTISAFTDYAFHEWENVNILKTGKLWFGEIYDDITSYDYQFTFPYIDLGSKVSIKTNMAARSSVNSNFDFYTDGIMILSTEINKINVLSTIYAYSTTPDSVSFYPSDKDITITVDFNQTSDIAIGWMNYIELNARRHLIFDGGQLSFRDNYLTGPGNTGLFKLANATASINVWDVTDIFNVKVIPGSLAGNEFSFKIAIDQLHEFVAFDGTFYHPVDFVEKIENQNLHALAPADFIIVSHPLFMDQAIRLAQLHYQYDDFTCIIVTPQEVYNEFSSGAQDITAIRDFCKMIYDKADSTNMPRYLLLFGDGSYDPKDRGENKGNFVPVFQSKESLKHGYSFVTDDYLGLFDPTEGQNAYGKTIDIGIGRFPVNTSDQAREVVDKIEHYLTRSDSLMGDWRNLICFIADDEDNNIHFKQAERLQTIIDTSYTVYNINKIYLDAYKQVSTPSGHRYPDVNTAIIETIEKGAIIINYTGHGGENGWSHEKVLDIPTINSWRNKNNMPLFITSTCSFGRFDDPSITSAGEWMMLNPEGAGVSLFTTTRLAWSDPNFKLNRVIIQHAFEKINGEYPRLGDLMRISKTLMHSSQSMKNWALLGDPALMLVYPEYLVKTISITQEEIKEQSDTIQSMSQVTVHGIITDESGNQLDGFNGFLIPAVFDKKIKNYTLGNDPSSQVVMFYLQNKVLYKGRISIINGEFTFTFIVPKDIIYYYGDGKISYYAYDTLNYSDARGYEKIIIGEVNPDAQMDYNGPEITLFLNDTNFVSGGYTDNNPVLLAFLNDEQGINAFGNGIGHDIIGYLDDASSQSFVLNNFFEPDIDSYQSGKITYQLYDLADGLHTLHIKAWDIYNNPTENSIAFVVNVNGQINLSSVYNYPNPFKSKTRFQFYHNKPDNFFDIDIEIYNIMGQLVRIIQQRVFAQGQKTEFIEWDGTNQNGKKLSSGAYFYKMKVRDEQGTYTEVSQKLIISK